MIKFLIWLILLLLCWPIAIIALIFYPIVWIFLLPFKLFGIAVEGILDLITTIFKLPSRLIQKL